MAKIQGYTHAIDLRSFDFSLTASKTARFGYDNNKNVVYQGVTYEDTYTIADLIFGTSVYMFGKSLSIHSGGFPKNGTVQAFGVSDYEGIIKYDLVEISDISVSFTKLHKTAMSGGRSDDYDLLKEILSANDTITLSSKDDYFKGFGGNDKLFGGFGDDTLFGGSGNDRLFGGADSDTLFGGDGADRFVYMSASDAASNDTIVNFQHGIDKIGLALVDADEIKLENDAFTFIGKQPFSAVAGQLRFSHTDLPGSTLVHGDLNGDAQIDFTITLSGTVKLSATDFYL